MPSRRHPRGGIELPIASMDPMHCGGRTQSLRLFLDFFFFLVSSSSSSRSSSSSSNSSTSSSALLFGVVGRRDRLLLELDVDADVAELRIEELEELVDVVARPLVEHLREELVEVAVVEAPLISSTCSSVNASRTSSRSVSVSPSSIASCAERRICRTALFPRTISISPSPRCHRDASHGHEYAKPSCRVNATATDFASLLLRRAVPLRHARLRGMVIARRELAGSPARRRSSCPRPRLPDARRIPRQRGRPRRRPQPEPPAAPRPADRPGRGARPLARPAKSAAPAAHERRLLPVRRCLHGRGGQRRRPICDNARSRASSGQAAASPCARAGAARARSTSAAPTSSRSRTPTSSFGSPSSSRPAPRPATTSCRPRQRAVPVGGPRGRGLRQRVGGRHVGAGRLRRRRHRGPDHAPHRGWPRARLPAALLQDVQRIRPGRRTGRGNRPAARPRPRARAARADLHRRPRTADEPHLESGGDPEA